MKTKSLILEILLIVVPIFGGCLIIQYQLNVGKTLENVSSSLCMFLPASISYWVMKNKIYNSNHPNPEKIIRIWQYLILGFYVSCIVFFILVSQHIVEKSIKDIGILWLVWMIIYGNFRVKIEPFYQDPIHFFVADEDIQKRAKRFSGKVMVFGGILSLILLLVLPKSLVGYVLIGYILSFCFATFFYGKILQWRKVA
jgi:prolipoprotein diacylglyceryltransferase